MAETLVSGGRRIGITPELASTLEIIATNPNLKDELADRVDGTVIDSLQIVYDGLGILASELNRIDASLKAAGVKDLGVFMLDLQERSLEGSGVPESVENIAEVVDKDSPMGVFVDRFFDGIRGAKDLKPQDFNELLSRALTELLSTVGITEKKALDFIGSLRGDGKKNANTEEISQALSNLSKKTKLEIVQATLNSVDAETDADNDINQGKPESVLTDESQPEELNSEDLPKDEITDVEPKASLDSPEELERLQLHKGDGIKEIASNDVVFPVDEALAVSLAEIDESDGELRVDAQPPTAEELQRLDYENTLLPGEDADSQTDNTVSADGGQGGATNAVPFHAKRLRKPRNRGGGRGRGRK